MSLKEEKKVIVKFNKPIIEQSINNSSNISRISGFMQPEYLLKIVKEVGLEANPRYSHENKITKDIMDTLKNTPDLFPFKSKGILIGTSGCKELERERYELKFSDTKIEGILDGGHNIFAIIKFLFDEYLDGIADKSKKWLDDMDQIFYNNYNSLLEEIIKDKSLESKRVNFLVPVEIIKPKKLDDINSDFCDILIDICSARNNNAQLKEETKDHKSGIYDFIKNEVLEEDISKKIIWTTNGEGEIPSTEIIALSWIVLKNFDEDIDFPLNKIYSSKGECIKKFSELIQKTDSNGVMVYSKKNPKNSKIEISSESLKSALMLLKDIPYIYDYLQKQFPIAYNNNGGSFGRITSVKQQSKSKREFLTKFYQSKCEYNFPEGFLIPVLCGLNSLVNINEKKIYSWKKDPRLFFEQNLSKLLASYKGMMDAFHYDPQAIGKNIATYNLINDLVKSYI